MQKGMGVDNVENVVNVDNDDNALTITVDNRKNFCIYLNTDPISIIFFPW